MIQKELIPVADCGNSIPLVSVHVITYNQAHFIHETLQSILAQDYENIEIVVADDGSTDGTANIIIEYACQYPKKIIPLVKGSNLGITGNSNRGLQACKGKYIAFIGGDDVFLPSKISTQVKYMQLNPECALSYHDLDVFQSDTGKSIGKFNSGKGSQCPHVGGVEALIKYGCFCGGCSVMVRSACTPIHGFDPHIFVASDWCFWIETALNGGAVGYIPEVLARYRRHAGNVTALGKNSEDVLLTVALVDAKYPQYSNCTRYFRSRYLYSLGVESYLCGRARMAIFYLIESLRLSWVSWKWFGWMLRSIGRLFWKRDA
jgi:glycosyltransferase involved in cell wall biosynthesis